MKHQLMALGLLTVTAVPATVLALETKQEQFLPIQTFNVSVAFARADVKTVFDEVRDPVERRAELMAVLFVNGKAVGAEKGPDNTNSTRFRLTQEVNTSQRRVPVRVALFDRDERENEPIDINTFRGNVLELEYEPATGKVFQNGRVATIGSRRETILDQGGSPNVKKKAKIRVVFNQPINRTAVPSTESSSLQ